MSTTSKEIVNAVNEIIQQYQTKLTLRQIYYRLVARNIIPNTISQYKALSRILVKAREDGVVPDDAIEDRARTVIGGDWGYNGPEEFIATEIRDFQDSPARYTRKLWENQPNYIEVWVEKDALSRIVSEIADNFRVHTCVGRGYSSYTYVKEAVERFCINCKKNCHILYFGDFDPSGLDITRDLGRRLSDYGATHVDVHRIALLPSQIEIYQLPPAPVKLSDSRASGFIEKYGSGVVELDALEPPVLQEMIDSTIRKYIDGGTWNETVKIIKEEQEVVKTKIDDLIKLWRNE